MKTELIEALQGAIHQLKTRPESYNWSNAEKCNCGILAQHVTGAGQEGVSRMLFEGDVYGSYCGMLDDSKACPTTGMPLGEIFEKMWSVGLVPDDLRDLEFLDNPIIMQEAGFYKYHLDHNKIIAVVAYMEAWVRILQREQGQTPQEEAKSLERTKIVYRTAHIPEPMVKELEDNKHELIKLN